jgi:hypothetical protein
VKTFQFVLVSDLHDFNESGGTKLKEGLQDVLNYFQDSTLSFDEIADGMLLVLTMAEPDIDPVAFVTNRMPKLVETLSHFQSEKALLDSLMLKKKVLILQKPTKSGDLFDDPGYQNFRNQLIGNLSASSRHSVESLNFKILPTSPLVSIIQEIIHQVLSNHITAIVNETMSKILNGFFHELLTSPESYASKSGKLRYIRDQQLHNEKVVPLLGVYDGIKNMVGNFHFERHVFSMQLTELQNLENILQFFYSMLPDVKQISWTRDCRIERKLVDWYKALGLYDHVLAQVKEVSQNIVVELSFIL